KAETSVSISVPRVKPRIKIRHAWSAIIKAINTIRILQISVVFESFYIFFIGVLVCVVFLLCILAILHLAICIIIIWTQVILRSLRLVIIYIISVGDLPTRRTRTQCQYGCQRQTTE